MRIESSCTAVSGRIHPNCGFDKAMPESMTAPALHIGLKAGPFTRL
jgi:hypothetical protein